MAPRPRILVVDDEPDLLDLLTLHLEGAGMEVCRADSGAEALAAATADPFDLAILDIMMDDVDGLEVLRRLRAQQVQTPVILLSARREDRTKVRGFGLGADDYVTKPFSPAELVARVRAHLRRAGRAGAPASPGRITCGPFSLDPQAQVVYKNRRAIPLTELETRVLHALLRRAGQAAGKLELYAEAWGHDRYDANSLNVYIKRLRRKLEDDPQRPRHILTVWGLGYRFAGDGHP